MRPEPLTRAQQLASPGGAITLSLEPGDGSLRGFRHWWAKTVTGFRDEVHCARCLIGPYVPSLGSSWSGQPTRVQLPPGALFYLCGVSAPYRWDRNFHLALAPADHALRVRTYAGQTVLIEGARVLPFSGADAARLYPERGAEFLTCRNFQFGAHYFAATA